MPLYDYKCRGCGNIFSLVTSIKDYMSTTPCSCGGIAQRHITQAPMVKGDYPGYDCPVTGKWIEGRRAHEENLKRQGCRLLEPGETQDLAKRKAREDDAFCESIGEAAAAEVARMPQRKQEQLAVELEHGADISIVRQ